MTDELKPNLNWKPEDDQDYDPERVFSKEEAILWLLLPVILVAIYAFLF